VSFIGLDRAESIAEHIGYRSPWQFFSRIGKAISTHRLIIQLIERSSLLPILRSRIIRAGDILAL